MSELNTKSIIERAREMRVITEDDLKNFRCMSGERIVLHEFSQAIIDFVQALGAIASRTSQAESDCSSLARATLARYGE